MYKFLINGTQWKDSEDSVESDVLYVARTLSRYSKCRVDIYRCNKKVATYIFGKPFNQGGAAA